MPFQHGINLCSQGISIKMLFTGYLCIVALGYLMALVQILFTHGMADGEFGLSVDDIVYSYYGKRSGSVLENKLTGSMMVMAPEEERFKIIEWVKKGKNNFYELYDYENDPHETQNLAVTQIDKYEPLIHKFSRNIRNLGEAEGCNALLKTKAYEVSSKNKKNILIRDYAGRYVFEH